MQTLGGEVEGVMEINAYHVNVKEMCSARVLPAYMNAPETMALTKKLEVRVNESSKKELPRSTRACHVEKRRKNGQKRAEAQNVEGKCKRGRTEIAIGDCIKSELERVGEEWENIR